MRYFILVVLVVSFAAACGGGGGKKKETSVKAPAKTVVETTKEAKKEEKVAPAASLGSKTALNGEEVFDTKGCAACHFADAGTNRKPFPSKELLAALSYDEFKNITIKGRAGTMMVAQDISDEETKAIYEWIKKFKK